MCQFVILEVARQAVPVRWVSPVGLVVQFCHPPLVKGNVQWTTCDRCEIFVTIVAKAKGSAFLDLGLIEAFDWVFVGVEEFGFGKVGRGL